MRQYNLKPSAPAPPCVCPQGIPIDPIEISDIFDAWKEDPATNRQQKVLKLFNYSFPLSITKGIATSYVARIFGNPHHRALWDRYVKLTGDIGSETPDLRPFHISDLLAVNLLDHGTDPAIKNPPQASMRFLVAIIGCGIPPTEISGPPPPTEAQIEFLRFIGKRNIPSTRRAANVVIHRMVFPVRNVLSKCFYNPGLIDEASQRILLKASRKSSVWKAALACDAPKLPDELAVSVIHIIFAVVQVPIREGLKIRGIQKLKPLLSLPS